MTEVELRLVTKNQSAVKGVRELNNEVERLGNTQKKQHQREMGLIADTEKALDDLKNARRKAYTIEDIEKYNKKIKEAELTLKDYETAGVKAAKQTETLTQSITEWAIKIAGTTVVLKVLKDAILATTTGINAMNIAGVVSKQVLYNLVTGTADLTKGLQQVIAAQKELNRLRIDDKIAMFEASKAMVDFRKYSVEAHDQTKTATERIKAYDKAIEANSKSINIQIKSTQEQILAYEKMLKEQGDDEKIKMKLIDLYIELNELDATRYRRLNEMTSMRSGLMKKELEDQKQYHEDLQKLIDGYLTSLWDLNNEISMINLTGLDLRLKQLEIAKDKELKEWGDTEERKYLIIKKYNLLIEKAQRDHLQALKDDQIAMAYGDLYNPALSGTGLLESALTPEKTDVPEHMRLRVNKAFYDAQKKMIDKAIKDTKDAEDEDLENKRKRVEAVKQLIYELASVAQDIADQSVDDAQRQREILDTRIAEAQRAMDAEVELYKAGYASNVGAKKQEIEKLKELRDQALKDEERAIEQKRKIDNLAQVSSLVTASAETIKAFPGPLLPIAIVLIALMWGVFLASKARAREITKLAEGGRGTVKGKLHSEGGEPFLSHVEVEEGEDWGVLSRGASRKYGKVFARMVDSFNKDKLIIPKQPGIRNIINLDTSSTNSRLERVEGQLIKLNHYFGGQEFMTDNGRVVISRKGNTTRIIKK